jgi:mannose-6-phosphate isomerase-like protein (cupin superfamily)
MSIAYFCVGWCVLPATTGANECDAALSRIAPCHPHEKINRMYRIRQQDLPFQGSSHQFVGADNGDVNISVFLLSALPGPHRHPYDEVQFVREGRGLWIVNGEEFEAGAGDILVIKAGEIHSFRCIGDAPLVQLDVHLSPRFIQENLT